MPASKVSVPLTVVIRTRSSVSDRVFDPLAKDIAVLPGLPAISVAVHMFDPSNVRTHDPDKLLAALFKFDTKPEVYDAPTTEAPAMRPEKQIYPVVSMPPESPNCICGKEVPFVLTPLNITVIRLTHDGIDVKSIDVPDVDATAVPDTIGANVPVVATNVCVLLPETAGADTVIVPDVSPERTTEAMIYPLQNYPAAAG